MPERTTVSLVTARRRPIRTPQRPTAGPAAASGPDAGTPTGPDVGTLVRPDAGTPTGPNAGTPTGLDAGTPTGLDAGTQVGPDAGTRAAPNDRTRTGPDAGTPLAPRRPVVRPPATAHDGLQGKWRWGWAFSAIWLVYLSDAVVAAWANPSPPRAVLGVAAIAVFGLLYVWAFGSVRSYRRAGRQVPNRVRAVVVVAAFGLFVLASWVAGERALTMLVFISVMVMFVFPVRIAVAVVALLIAIAEIAPRLLPGWEPLDSFGFQIAVTALAMWGITQLVQRNAQLAAAQEQLAELAVTNERTRFARDLHDILGHSLTVLTVKAELAGRLVRLDPERAEQEIGEVERLGREALADVRAAVGGYREASLAAELVSARAALDAAGIEAVLPSAVDEVPGERRELLGWAVREGVTNVVRHSGARHCWIRLTPDGVEVADDGRGPGRGPAEGGNGLTGLRERAGAAGASLVLGRAEEGGFRMRVGW